MRSSLLLALALLVAACGRGADDSAPAPSPAAAETEDQGVQRIAGPDRFATAAALALDRYTSASDAVVARADDPADALAGSYVAGSHIGPLLLSDRDEVPEVTIETLRSRGVRHVRILGGTDALSERVQRRLEQEGFSVERVAGPDRYATAAAVAANSGSAAVGVRGDRGRAAILANGVRPADALAAGPIAYGQQWPVLLTAADALPAPTRTALDQLQIAHVVVVGGTGAVSDAVVADLERSGRTVERVAGPDRLATAAAVADFLIGLGVQVARIEVAGATSFADALALGPHAAPDAPVLLCASRDHCGRVTLDWIEAHAEAVTRVVVAGGTGVIGDLAADGLRVAAAS